MVWESCSIPSGVWFWWVTFRGEWTAWVIDDSIKRGGGTEYRIAASLGTVTFFSHRRYARFREAKMAALELVISLQVYPLEGSGRFSKKN
jgi:hypothetical protein